MIKYDKYKPSGIEWLGDIPNDWEVKRVKDIFNQISQSGNDLPENGYVPLENIEQFTGKLIQRVSNENNETTNLFNAGDILLNKLRPYLGKIFLPDFNGGVSGEVIVLRLLNSGKFNNSKYFFYRFLSTKFIFKINSMTDGVKMPRTNPSKILNLNIAVPQLQTQTKIANYLDSKTQSIDKKINLLTQKANYYKEYRKSLINETVCKGLPSTSSGNGKSVIEPVEMKDSCIDWIGQIPKHWEVKRLKNIAKTIKGENLDFFDKPFENSLPNLSLDYLRNDTVTFNNYCYSSDKTLLADENDIIIIWDGAGVGEILKAKKGFISSTIAKFDFNKSLSSKYFFHLRDNIEYVLKQIPTGMGIPHLNPHILNNFPCPFPPLYEQTQIAHYLDQKTQTIDKIVFNINTQIATLKELRKTLINDAVTGKIKVAEVVES